MHAVDPTHEVRATTVDLFAGSTATTGQDERARSHRSEIYLP